MLLNTKSLSIATKLLVNLFSPKYECSDDDSRSGNQFVAADNYLR